MRGFGKCQPSSPLKPVAQRDYILRLIEQAIQVLLRITSLRESGQPGPAVAMVIEGLEKLFGLTVTELGSLDMDQLFLQLTAGEQPGSARDKCLIFAALNNQAGLAYEERDLPGLAQPAFHIALVFTLRALAAFPRSALPPFAPDIGGLLARLDGFELPEATRSLIAAYRASLSKPSA